MTDATLECGLKVIRIINDSLGIGNKGRRLIGEKKKAGSLYEHMKKA